MCVCVCQLSFLTRTVHTFGGERLVKGGVLGIGVLYVLGEWILNFFFSFSPLILFCFRSRFFRNAMGRKM